MNGELPQAILTIGGLTVLFVLSAVFSGSETALFSLSRTQAKRLSGGTPGERCATRLLREPQRLLSTILIGNMAVNVLIATLLSRLARDLFGGGSIGIAIGTTTILLLIFGELTPKTIAVHQAALIARFTSIPLHVLGIVITPLRAALRFVTNLLLRLLGQHGVPGWSMLTRDEVSAMLEVGEAAGVTTDRERELAEHILDLNNIEGHDIMVPRTEVSGLDDTLTLREAFEAARTERHSRLPVYQEDLDGIWAILAPVNLPRWRSSPWMDRTLCDLRPEMEAAWEQGRPTPVYPPFLVPETALVEQLLAQMRKARAHLAVLVDEYGGTAGILTLRDVLAEIVGQISPAGETTPSPITKGDGFYLVDGRTRLRDVSRELQLELPSDDIDTIGGYAMELIGRLPRAGDAAEAPDCRLRIVKMAGRRVDMVRVEPTAPSAGGQEANDDRT